MNNNLTTFKILMCWISFKCAKLFLGIGSSICIAFGIGIIILIFIIGYTKIN